MFWCWNKYQNNHFRKEKNKTQAHADSCYRMQYCPRADTIAAEVDHAHIYAKYSIRLQSPSPAQSLNWIINQDSRSETMDHNTFTSNLAVTNSYIVWANLPHLPYFSQWMMRRQSRLIIRRIYIWIWWKGQFPTKESFQQNNQHLKNQTYWNYRVFKYSTSKKKRKISLKK